MIALIVAACASGSPSTSLNIGSEEISDYQREVLEDGVVTFSEYESAVLATMSCIEDNGFGVRGPFDFQGGLSFDVIVAPGEQLMPGDMGDTGSDVLAQSDRAVEDCEAHFLFPLVDVYNEANAPPSIGCRKATPWFLSV
ncbi:MAG: hypothetical protein KDB69_07285 [Acidimicrobiia bacterium]|nr:hypothetical protein [Acidimicrobiia bacterium]